MNAINAVKIDVINPQANANNTEKQPVKIAKIQPQQAHLNNSSGVMKVGDIPVSNEKMPAQYAQYALLPKPDKDGKMKPNVAKVASAEPLKSGYMSTPSYGPYAAIPDPYLAPYFNDPTMFATNDPYANMIPQSGTSLTMPYFYPPLPGHYPGDIYT